MAMTVNKQLEVAHAATWNLGNDLAARGVSDTVRYEALLIELSRLALRIPAKQREVLNDLYGASRIAPGVAA